MMTRGTSTAGRKWAIVSNVVDDVVLFVPVSESPDPMQVDLRVLFTGAPEDFQGRHAVQWPPPVGLAYVRVTAASPAFRLHMGVIC
jgi:hypothetical protein